MTEDEFWDRLFAGEGLHFHWGAPWYRLVWGVRKRGPRPQCNGECHRMTWAQILARAMKEAGVLDRLVVDAKAAMPCYDTEAGWSRPARCDPEFPASYDPCPSCQARTQQKATA